MFMSAAAIVIKQQFMNGMRFMKVSELKLDELKAREESVRRYNGLFEMMNDLTITSALTVIEGMPMEIDNAVKKEIENRKLETLNVELL